MKTSTLNNIKESVNQLIKNNIKLTTETLSKEAHTSKRTVTEFFKMFPKESFDKYYKNGTDNGSAILKDSDKNGTIENSTISIQEDKSGTDSNLINNGTAEQNGTDTNLENGTADNGTIENGTEQNGTTETFDVMTDEGFVNQLNRLYRNGTIDKEYYLQQVELMKNTYSKMYERIKEKLLMN